MTKPTVALIGTLDTKGPEIGFIRSRLADLDVDSLVIDSGILGTPGITADIPREQVAEAAGATLKEVQDAGSRSAAVELMQVGLRTLIRGLYEDGAVQGVLCLGGAEGGLMGAAAMQALPVGVPKLVVSPSASGRREFGPFMGSSDILVMHSVIDILGLNSVARSVFGNAAAAMAGMCRWGAQPPKSDRPSIGITMLGQTTPGAMVVAKRLEEAGYEPIIFHANGVGGPAMDDFARDGVLAGVIDFTLSEISNTMFDGVHTAGPDRMRAAVEQGIPLLVVPGALDFFNQGAIATVPVAYLERQHYRHNPVATLIRVNGEEMSELGRRIAEKLGDATAPTAVMVPTGGLSLVGVAGGPIADAGADRALLASLEENLPAAIPVEVLSTDINSAEFGEAVAARFLELMREGGSTTRSEV
jgi:uncharacterized protein (UPF0261 family)